MTNSVIERNFHHQVRYEEILQSDFDRTKNVSDGEIFAAEFVPHFQVLRRYALHLVRNPSQADDLVQETFTQALMLFDRYEMGTNCRAWLCKIMYNKRLHWIRSNARFCQFNEGELHFPAIPSAILPFDFISETLRETLKKIPQKYRKVVWLAEVEEYTYREISEHLNIPIGTVMSRLHRGRRMLQVNFESLSVKRKKVLKTH